jgi:serine/threonine protein kinase
MECINNARDLAEMINDLPEKRFGEDDAKTIISQVLKGLSHLHSLNICHRDLKLENVLWSSED